MKIDMRNGERVEATYVKHLRTLTSRHTGLGNSNIDVDLYRLEDGTEVVAKSKANDARSVPYQMDVTPEQAMFID